jgi:hypothetical protein
MLGFPAYRSLIVLLLISGCPDRLVPGEPLATATTGDAPDSVTGSEHSSTSGAWAPESTTDAPEPTTTIDDATTTELPARCGPPCAHEWTHEGPLVLGGGAGPADITCLRAVVDGDLYIGADADLAQIASLAHLERVEGKLTIAGNPHLTDLAGLACLREVEALTLAHMPQLVDLDALAGLRRAPQIVLDGLGIAALPAFAPEFTGVTSLHLRDNPALVDLHAAAGWGAAGDALDLRLRNNAALPSLVGLDGLLADLGFGEVHLELTDLPALTSLAGLEPLVFADLHFERLPLVQDLAPLANLEIGGQITFDVLPGVTDLVGLGALTTVGTFTLGDCAHSGVGGMDGLVSLAGLDSLVSVGHLALADNDQLASLAGAPLLTELGGFAGVGNPKLGAADYATLLGQVQGALWTCVGDWDRCQCAPLSPS